MHGTRTGRTVAGLAGLVLLAWLPPALADEQLRLACAPRTFDVLPGEPVRLELVLLADSAAPVRIQIPADPLLALRAVEKPPLRRTDEGVIIHRRVVVWQALEPGTVRIKPSVEAAGRKRHFPEITIRVRDPGP